MVPDILYKLFQSSKQQQENEYYYPYFLFYLKGTKFYKNEGYNGRPAKLYCFKDDIKEKELF